MTDTRHIFTPFEESLNRLRDDVLMMATLTLRALGNARQGLFQRDDAACAVAIADDEEIDTLEMQIDREGLDVLMRYQPVASDMRAVLSAMKMSANIERVADQIVSIARRARKLNEHAPLAELELLRPMFDAAENMFSDAVRYYAEGNQELARGMKERDRVVDAMNRDLTNQYATCMEQNTAELRGYLNLIFICRVLERIGDHATNICEEVVFVCAAEDIRHTQNG